MPDATIVLTSLFSNVSYASPVLDPWYRAVEKYLVSTLLTASGLVDVNFYAAVSPSVLGCVEKAQLCNPAASGTEKCASILEYSRNETKTDSLGFNSKQTATAARLYDAITRSDLDSAVYYLTERGLLASSLAMNLQSPGLPHDQWKLEVQNWFATGLTALQLSTMQYVTGYGNSNFDKYLTSPSDAEKWMCSIQMVQRSDFTSFVRI